MMIFDKLLNLPQIMAQLVSRHLWKHFFFFKHLAFNANFTQHGVLLLFPGFSQNYEPANRATSSIFLTSPPTQNFIWRLSLIPNIKRRPKKYYGKWLSVLDFSILRSTYFYEFSSFLWTCGKDLIRRIYSQHKLFFIAYCLLQKLNLGPKNNFDKGFSFW